MQTLLHFAEILPLWARMGLVSLSLALLCYEFFRWCDKFFPAHTKEKLTERLQGRPSSPWPELLIEWNDHLFVGGNPQKAQETTTAMARDVRVARF